jgi:hypothetical protein
MLQERPHFYDRHIAMLVLFGYPSFWNSSDLGGRKSRGPPTTSVMLVPMSAKHFWMKCLLLYDNVTLSPLLLPARVTNRSHSTYGSSARSDSHRAVFCPNSVVSGWKN